MSSAQCLHMPILLSALWDVLGSHGRFCYLQYANDLLILTVGEREDLRIIKLILYRFEGISSLKINFNKACFYLTKFSFFPGKGEPRTLYYSSSLLPFTCLGVPIV